MLSYSDPAFLHGISVVTGLPAVSYSDSNMVVPQQYYPRYLALNNKSLFVNYLQSHCLTKVLG